MALSNNTLSGCFDPIPASGFTDFLFEQAAVIISMPNVTPIKTRRDIKTSDQDCRFSISNCRFEKQRDAHLAIGSRHLAMITLSPAPLPPPPSTTPPHSSLDRHSQTRRCPPPEFPRPPAPRRPPCRALRPHLLRCGKSACVGCVSRLIAASCEASTE